MPSGNLDAVVVVVYVVVAVGLSVRLLILHFVLVVTITAAAQQGDPGDDQDGAEPPADRELLAEE